MENSKPLATESFSYSWLVDRKPIFDENYSGEKELNFNFDVPFTGSPIAFVHADEIFADGHIMPIYVDRTEGKASIKTSSISVPPSPFSSPYSSPFPTNKNQHFLLEKWTKSSKRILRKCFGFMKPLIERSRKSSSRVDDLERKVCEARSWSNSLQASPRRSLSTYWAVDWSSDLKKIGSSKVDVHYGLQKAKSWSINSPQASPRISPSCSSNSWSCDVESSIHEAILYCKRSIEK